MAAERDRLVTPASLRATDPTTTTTASWRSWRITAKPTG
jgi:hypothetical protein